MTFSRAALLVALVSCGANANSLGNGFAIDDVGIVRENPSVTDPTFEAVLLEPYWPSRQEGTGLYRPLAIASFALQWWAFDGSTVGFHAVSVAAHTAVSLLLLLLLSGLVPVAAALAGALLFAVHPVHVEAVANVVGQSELGAAAAVLLACLLYLAGAAWTGWKRGARLAAIAALYALALGAKEIAATLPALLLTLELARMDWAPVRRKLRSELPLYIALGAVLATYLVVRTAVLGTAVGEAPAPALIDLSAAGRIATAVSVWPHYLRLLLIPVDLSSDYGPGVLAAVDALSIGVLAGLVVIGGLLVLAWVARTRAPLATLGIVWFCVAILPVSNLLLPAGVLLAERTLYLPSVGLSVVAAGLVARWLQTVTDPGRRRVALATGVVVLTLLTARTALRNPTWFDTYTVLNTLALEHPESYLALRARAEGLARVGDTERAGEAFEAAVALAPSHYSLNLQAAQFYGSRGEFGRAEQLLVRAIRYVPDLPEAHFLLSNYLISSNRAQEAHAVALAGLARVGPDASLYAVVSETYIAKGDLDAAVRARLAALGQAPESGPDWGRLADLYEAMGRLDEARAARARQAATSAG
jgi:Tfp pilus assembly protein PilF